MRDFFVVVVNPYPDKSISCKVGLTALRDIKKKNKNIEIEILNLYDYKIPYFRRSKSYKSAKQKSAYKLPKDLTKIVEKMRDYKVYIFIFPIWWSNIPAILKNFFDWSVLFAVDYDFKSTPKPLLKNKKAFLITACGASDYPKGEKKQMINLVKRDILHWWGVRRLETVFIEGTNHIKNERIERKIKECQAKLLALV